MKRSPLALLRGAALALAALGCGSPAHEPEVCASPQGDTSQAKALAGAYREFAVALDGPVIAAAGAGQNVVFSPFSLSSVLMMLSAGAAGETATQIQALLHLPGSAAGVAPAYATLACQDETDGSVGGQTLSLANSVWAQQGKAFEPSFLSLLQTGYDAALQQVDFAKSPMNAAAAINQWADGETHGLIPTLLGPTDIDGATQLVLVNAVYFKGAWAHAFDPSKTRPTTFTREDGSTVEAEMMWSVVTYASGSVSAGSSYATVYELPYLGGNLVFDVVVPYPSLAAFEAALSPASLDALLGSIKGKDPALFIMPKFSITTRLALSPILQGMGMTDAFAAGTADLSGMDGARDLFVSNVVQQAVLQVDEAGSTAAAVTAASTIQLACDCVTIDSPFLFLIRDRRNGSVLFLGHVLDPTL
jgi:serpin B